MVAIYIFAISIKTQQALRKAIQLHLRRLRVEVEFATYCRGRPGFVFVLTNQQEHFQLENRVNVLSYELFYVV